MRLQTGQDLLELIEVDAVEGANLLAAEVVDAAKV